MQCTNLEAETYFCTESRHNNWCKARMFERALHTENTVQNRMQAYRAQIAFHGSGKSCRYISVLHVSKLQSVLWRKSNIFPWHLRAILAQIQRYTLEASQFWPENSFAYYYSGIFSMSLHFDIWPPARSLENLSLPADSATCGSRSGAVGRQLDLCWTDSSCSLLLSFA